MEVYGPTAIEIFHTIWYMLQLVLEEHKPRTHEQIFEGFILSQLLAEVFEGFLLLVTSGLKDGLPILLVHIFK